MQQVAAVVTHLAGCPALRVQLVIRQRATDEDVALNRQETRGKRVRQPVKGISVHRKKDVAGGEHAVRCRQVPMVAIMRG